MKTEEEKLFSDGANWVKCDFHLHSPIVHSFELPSGINLSSENDIDELISKYIECLKEKEIKICAITDYQQVNTEWFPKLQIMAKEKNIYVFPGIELSVNVGRGLHILLIFDYNENIEGINDYIKSIDKNPQKPLIINKRGHRDIELKEDLAFALQGIKEKFHSLIIFPHPEDDNGLIKSCQVQEAAKYLKIADAVENISQGSIDKLVSTGELKKEFFESKIAIIESTDPKSFDDIGNKRRGDKIRCTFLKLSCSTLNSIRIAFQDPSIRVSIYEKPVENLDCITSISISGSGFLKDIKLDFNKNLNCFIGGRGVGKSALLESIRYCLGLNVYAEKSFIEEFVPNVIGSGGKITVKLSKKYGDQVINYTIERIIGQEARVLEKDITPEDLFEDNKPIFLGQKELYELSKNEIFQRQLIDQLIGDDIVREKIEFQKEINSLKDNSRKLSDIENKLIEKENNEQRLKTINEQIKTFKVLGVAEKMDTFAKLTKDDKILENAILKFTEGKNELNIKFNDYIDEIETSIKSLEKSESIEKMILLNAKNILDKFLELLKAQVININKEINENEEKLMQLKNEWDKNFDKHKEETESIKKELSEKGLSSDKYESLIKEKTNLESLLKEYQKIEISKQQLKKERNTLKDKIKTERHSIFRLRQNRIVELNKKLEGRVKLEVSYLADKNEFRDKMINILRGSKVNEDAISNIIDNKNIAVDGIEISKILSKGKDELQNKFGLTIAMASRIFEWLKDKNRLFELETYFPEDLITINLKVGEEYRPFYKISENGGKIYQLSDGQRATALLILLFSQENKILIIDQPEEDLDNRFVYDDVVVMLRQMKGKRQLIFATHNANIPVLGDSEQIIVLEAENNQCSIKDSGSIDKFSISDDIKKVMEGGEEAFKKRIQKYGVKYE